jgi:hypothetical protein
MSANNHRYTLEFNARPERLDLAIGGVLCSWLGKEVLLNTRLFTELLALSSAQLSLK